MTRFGSMIIIGAVGLLLTGCPGSLDDPERFQGSCDVEADIFGMRCAVSLCHDSASSAVGLDLSGANVGASLVGQPTALATVERAECDGAGALIDAADPESSVLLLKGTSSPGCGSPMPLGSMGLSPEELACLRAYVLEAASGGGGGADAGSTMADGGP